MVEAEERAQLVAEVRDCARTLLDSLHATGEALLVIASGVVVINGRYRELAADGIDPARVDDHHVRMIYGPAHECVHMSQLLTTRFVLEMGVEFFNLATLASPHRRSKGNEAAWLPEVLAGYREAQRRLNDPGEGRFTSLQVMEAHAVLEGFRGGMSRHLAPGLAAVRRLAHGDLADYSVIIDAALDAWGFDLTLEVLPALCWLALNDQDPGMSLSKGVDSLSLQDVQWLSEASAADTCRAFGRDPLDLARSWRTKRPGLREHPLHGLFGRYFDVLEAETDPEAYLQLAMHPGRGKSSGSAIPLRQLMPPMAVYADDVFLMNGPYRDEGWSAAEPLLRISALVMESIGWLDGQARKAGN